MSYEKLYKVSTSFLMTEIQNKLRNLTHDKPRSSQYMSSDNIVCVGSPNDDSAPDYSEKSVLFTLGFQLTKRSNGKFNSVTDILRHFIAEIFKIAAKIPSNNGYGLNKRIHDILDIDNKHHKIVKCAWFHKPYVNSDLCSKNLDKDRYDPDYPYYTKDLVNANITECFYELFIRINKLKDEVVYLFNKYKSNASDKLHLMKITIYKVHTIIKLILNRLLENNPISRKYIRCHSNIRNSYLNMVDNVILSTIKNAFDIGSHYREKRKFDTF
jgi:hypothetical protein